MVGWVALLFVNDEYITSLKTKGVMIPEFFEQALGRLDMNVWATKTQIEYKVDLFDRIAYATALAVE